MDTTATLQAREDATVYRYRMRKVDVSYSICPSVAAGCPYIHSFRVSDSADSTFKPPPSVRSTKDLFGFAIPDLKALSSDPSTLISSAGVGVQAEGWGLPNEQSQSKFMRLPGELRNQIYQWCLLGPSATCGAGLSMPQDNMVKVMSRSVQITSKRQQTYFIPTKEKMMCDSYAVPEGRVLAVQLFLTCRKLHEEAASYFYGHNVFKFESLRILAAFLADHNALSSRSSQWLNRISIPFRPEEPTSSGRYQLGRGLTFYDTPADYGITSTHDIWPFVAQFLTHSHLPALTQIDLRVTVTLAGTVAKGLLGSDRSMTQAQAQAMAQLPHHLTQQVQTHLTINNQVIGPNNVLTALQHLQLTNNANGHIPNGNAIVGAGMNGANMTSLPTLTMAHGAMTTGVQSSTLPMSQAPGDATISSVNDRPDDIDGYVPGELDGDGDENRVHFGRIRSSAHLESSKISLAIPNDMKRYVRLPGARLSRLVDCIIEGEATRSMLKVLPPDALPRVTFTLGEMLRPGLLAKPIANSDRDETIWTQTCELVLPEMRVFWSDAFKKDRHPAGDAFWEDFVPDCFMRALTQRQMQDIGNGPLGL